MTSVNSNGSPTPSPEGNVDRSSAPRKGSHSTLITSLDELRGAHPAALRELFERGTATQPEDLGPTTRGLLLASERARDVHFLVRPLLRALSTDAMPWKGKAFEPDGTGKNLIFGRSAVPFAWETGPSELDGAPALILRYDVAGNVWPIRNLRDELRTIADGIAIGPALFGRSLLMWFGLERGH